MTKTRLDKGATLAALHIISYVGLTNILVRTYLEYHIPNWGYLGYLSDYSTGRHFVANIGAVCLALIVPMRMVGLTSFTLVLVASSTVSALLAMYATRGYSILYLVSLFVFLLIVRIIANRTRFKIPRRKSSSVPITALTAGGLGLSMAWVAARGGLANINFDIFKIYSVRDSAMEQYFVGPFAYILNWATKMFGTTVLALGLAKKNIFFIMFAVIGQVYFYATLGQVTPLAMLVFILAAIIVARYRPGAWVVNVALIVLILVSEFLIELYGNSAIVMNSIVVKRLFFGPADAMILYYEFFSENPFTFFSTTFLRGIVDYQYDVSVLDLIAILKTGETELNPNVGILGTGYQHMGYFGLLFYAVFAGLVLAVFESLSKYIPAWVPLAIAGPSMYIMFTSSDMARSLLTHGGFVALLILFLWPSGTVPPAGDLSSQKPGHGLQLKPSGEEGQ